MTSSKRRRGVSLFLLVASLSACSSMQHSSLASTPRPLFAASNFLHPPFSSLDENGKAIGLEVDLVAEAARRLGREVEWVERPFGQLLSAVAAGEVDLAASTIGVTEARAERVAFSAPYFETTIVALVRLGDGEPRTLDQLNGRRVASDRGTTAVSAVAARIPRAQRVLDRTGEATWARMLTDHSIDAIALDRSHAEKFMTDAGTRFHIVEEPLQKECFAVALQHDRTELRAVLDEVIEEHLRRASPGLLQR